MYEVIGTGHRVIFGGGRQDVLGLELYSQEVVA